MDATSAWFLVAAVLVLIGLLGTVLPVLPGLPVMFAGMWLAAWADGYARIGVGTLLLLGALVLVSIAVDFAASFLGARHVGASRKGQVGAGLGGVVGLFFGLPGLVAGPFLGAALGEMADGKGSRDAARIGLGTWIGMIIGALLKLALALAMLAIFLGALLLG